MDETSNIALFGTRVEGAGSPFPDENELGGGAKNRDFSRLTSVVV